MLIRRLARPLLASTFVAGGVDALLHPEQRAKSAAALLRNAQRVSPESVAVRLAADPATLVRITATTQVVAGTLLALGKAPRWAALSLAFTVIPTAIVEQDFWAEDDPDRKAAKRAAFVKDLGLLGGTLIAAADTEGRPSLSWRGRRAAHRAADALSGALPAGAGHHDHSADVVRRLHEAAGHGRLLADVSADKAVEIAEAAQAHGTEIAEIVKERGTRLASTIREHGAQLTDAAHDQVVTRIRR